jgi:Rps23 Pro-64 3,4-dihydroxylase Tpa1-like proline 4-hydroxylase
MQELKDELINEGIIICNLEDFLSDDDIIGLENYYQRILKICDTEMDQYFIYRHNYQPPNNQPQDYQHKLKLRDAEERDKFCKDNDLLVWQAWLESSPPDESGLIDFPFDIGLKIVKQFYPEFTEGLDHRIAKGNISLFEDGHFICNHRDGKNTGRICGIIIYLTPESEYHEGGGELVSKTNSDKTVIAKPTFGKFSLFDFTENNIEHEVNPVKNGFKRFAYINFFTLRDENFNGIDLTKKTNLI